MTFSPFCIESSGGFLHPLQHPLPFWAESHRFVVLNPVPEGVVPLSAPIG